MVMRVSLPVALSLAVTFRMPLASMSKVTSICGTPRGAGGMPASLNLPSVRFCAARGRSPCSTWTSTSVCESAAVENVSVFLVGIVVLRGIIGVATPPSVSIASVSGVTSSSSRSFTSPASTPACTAAPIATTSSGFTLRCGSRPNSFFTISWILGMRVCPPTRTTSSMSLAVTPGVRHRLLARLQRPVKQVLHQLLQLGARQLAHQVLRPAGVRGHKRQVDLRLDGCRELDLGLLRGVSQPLQRHLVALRARSSPCSCLNSAISHSTIR